VSALFALGATAVEGRFREFVREGASALLRPTGIAVLAFLALSVISISWSQFNDISIQALGEFWLPIAGAFILCQVLPKRMTRLAFWILAGSVAAACLLIVVELETGLTLRRSLGMRADSFIWSGS
jgi:hypothetical protein